MVDAAQARVSCRLSSVVIRFMREHYGEEAAAEVLERAGAEAREVEDLDAWTSFECYDRIWKSAAEVSADPRLGFEIARFSMASRELGPMMAISRGARMLGKGSLGIRSLPLVINRSTTCIHYRAVSVEDDHAVIEVCEPAGVVDPARCDCRAALFRAIPEMWGAEAGSAQVEHTRCVEDGSPSCLFEVRWRDPVSSRIAWTLAPVSILLALGVGVGSWAFGAVPAAAVALGLMAGLVILLAGRGRASTLRLEQTVLSLEEHQRQMTVTATDSEKRYSELRKTYEELEQRGEELERARAELDRQERMAAMGRLLSGVAHELNNPLAGILTSAELLQRLDEDGGAGQGETGVIAGRIIEGVERCRRLNRNMLDFSRQRPAKQEPVDLAEIVHAALDLLAYELRTSNIELSLQITQRPAVVVGDRGQLQQVVLNLLENAVLSLQDSQTDRCLTVGLDVAGGHVRLDVRDDGVGIPASIREQVFDPFFTTREVGTAVGLGLSLSHRFVTAHKGTVELLEMGDGEGAHFCVSLPVALLGQAASEAPDEPAARPQSPATAPAHLSPMRVLIVDDETSITQMVCRLLKEYGHEPIGVSDARQARVHLADDGPFDVILLDIKLPGETGPEFFGQLSPDVQDSVIFMTGAVADESTEEFLFEFIERTLTKPFTYRELLEIVRGMLSPGKENG